MSEFINGDRHSVEPVPTIEELVGKYVGYGWIPTRTRELSKFLDELNPDLARPGSESRDLAHPDSAEHA